MRTFTLKSAVTLWTECKGGVCGGTPVVATAGEKVVMVRGRQERPLVKAEMDGRTIWGWIDPELVCEP